MFRVLISYSYEDKPKAVFFTVWVVCTGSFINKHSWGVYPHMMFICNSSLDGYFKIAATNRWWGRKWWEIKCVIISHTVQFAIFCVFWLFFSLGKWYYIKSWCIPLYVPTFSCSGIKVLFPLLLFFFSFIWKLLGSGWCSRAMSRVSVVVMSPAFELKEAQWCVTLDCHMISKHSTSDTSNSRTENSKITQVVSTK